MYRPEKGNDFRMLDRNIAEQFQVGGTDVYVHKYVGPVDPVSGEATATTPVNGNPISELGIQDVLFMENRDRKYDPDVFVMRGIYTMQDIDFNLMQFGFFLNNDNVMITFHLRNTVETLGRKLMIGDVLELPLQATVRHGTRIYFVLNVSQWSMHKNLHRSLIKKCLQILIQVFQLGCLLELHSQMCFHYIIKTLKSTIK
jgi:hypothetical protein